MFLTKRANGVYYVVFQNPDGKKSFKSTGSKSKKDAYKFLANFEATAIDIKPDIPEMKLFDFMIKFMEYSQANHSKLTVRDYNFTFKKFMKFVGSTNLKDVTSEMIYSYITNRIKTASIFQGRKVMSLNLCKK